MSNQYREPNKWDEFTYSTDDMKKVKPIRTWRSILALLTGKKRRATKQALRRDQE